MKKLTTWFNAVGVARKHSVDWLKLAIFAFLGRKGVFRSRASGTISCDAKKLLKQLVRLEDVWKHIGDNLPVIKFEDDDVVIPDYFGRDFRIPLKAMGINPPSAILNAYPFDVRDEKVLDIGAYLGDTPLMWLYKGAKSVIAVEPVPLHFQYLEKNTAGLPVICLNVSVGGPLPKLPNHEGSGRYGLVDDVGDELLDVPVVQLTELVERYRPTVVKLNCEGCEHYVLEELSEIHKLGVKIICVQFHDIRGYSAYESLAMLESRLGKSTKTLGGETTNLSGKIIETVTAYWSL